MLDKRRVKALENWNKFAGLICGGFPERIIIPNLAILADSVELR